MTPVVLTAESPVITIPGPADPFPPVPEPDAVDIAREQNRAARAADAQSEKAAAVAAAKERLRAVLERAESVPAAFAPVPQPVTPDAPVAPGTVALHAQDAVARRTALRQIDGAETLNYARMFLARFALWPGEAALDAVTLWAAHAHSRTADGMLTWQCSPRLLFQSAEPGSGKSHAMALTARLCPSPQVLVEPSEPAVAQLVGREHSTIFFDEADVLFGKGARKAAIRALINTGYQADGVWCRVRHGAVDKVPAFGAMGLAGLDSLETSTDGILTALLTRCIRIRMRRGPAGWLPPRFDSQARSAATIIAKRLSGWAAQSLTPLGDEVPEVPEGIGNREAQIWEPLLVTADAAGGRWPEAARMACEELTVTGVLADQDEDDMSELDAWIASLSDN